jgi:hypothetical protein
MPLLAERICDSFDTVPFSGNDNANTKYEDDQKPRPDYTAVYVDLIAVCVGKICVMPVGHCTGSSTSTGPPK